MVSPERTSWTASRAVTTLPRSALRVGVGNGCWNPPVMMSPCLASPAISASQTPGRGCVCVGCAVENHRHPVDVPSMARMRIPRPRWCWIDRDIQNEQHVCDEGPHASNPKHGFDEMPVIYCCSTATPDLGRKHRRVRLAWLSCVRMGTILSFVKKTGCKQIPDEVSTPIKPTRRCVRQRAIVRKARFPELFQLFNNQMREQP
jgi:hypothetical protein